MAEENQEKAYKVKDKRRVNPDGTLKEDQERAEEQQPAEAAAGQ